jgi:DNA-binding response OmpR family regulator
MVAVYDVWHRRHLADMLSAAGYEVLRPSNGAAAVRLCRVHRCDLILADGALPELSGPYLMCALHEEWRTWPTPIVAFLMATSAAST